jgi:DNA-binding transcriptional ArsR family regulator
MANETMKKVKDNVRKGMAEVGKTAAHLKADAKAEVTRIQVTDTDAEPRIISGNKTDAEKTSEAVELIFGINAGIIWESLNLNGPMSVSDLAAATSLLPEDIYGALGWLGRENKISVERDGTVRVYSLRLEN